jgi:hypothetical protein
LCWRRLRNTLGANPAEALIRSTGDWTLRFLCLTLAVTPLRQLDRLAALAAPAPHAGPVHVLLRRAALPVLCLAGHGLDLAAILKDIPKRPFILVGSAALLLMLPLAATSFNRAIAGWARALAGAAPRRLRGRPAGAAALLLDARRQERLRRVVGLRRHLACCWAGGSFSYGTHSA